MVDKLPQNAKYTMLSDEDLAEKCRRGDKAAFQELMRRYMRPIYNFSRQYARTAEDAEDVSQDTFYKVWKYIKRYTKGRQFRPWLYTIARNTALDYLKKKRASSFSDLDDQENEIAFADTLQDPDPLPQELFENAALTEELVTAMKTLHPDHRAVLTLHYNEDLTFDEIAAIMNKPMNTVKSWHRRALIRLKDLLTHQGT